MKSTRILNFNLIALNFFYRFVLKGDKNCKTFSHHNHPSPLPIQSAILFSLCVGEIEFFCIKKARSEKLSSMA
jgi:hypothetical protein